MVKIPVIDHVEYLVCSKFPELARAEMLARALSGNRSEDGILEWTPPSDEVTEKAEKFQKKLLALSMPELKTLYEEELIKKNLEEDQNASLISLMQMQILNIGLKIKELDSSKVENKPLHTKERETLLKLVIGMAVGGYGYEPNANRSPTAKEIADDLAIKGISIDPDTVRKWLKEASELWPPSPKEPACWNKPSRKKKSN